MISDQILHGDCTSILPTLPDGSADLVLTDPPYGVRYRDRHGRTIENDDDLSVVLGAFKDLYRVLRPDSLCICFYSWNRVDAFFEAWRTAGFRPVGHIVWHKGYASSARFLQARHEQAYLLARGHPATPSCPLSDVQPWEYSGNRAHPTEKAVSILTPLIRCFSQPGSLVLDPFAGVGSTAVAAALTRRRYIGIELEERYCTVARNRLAGVARYQQRTAETPPVLQEAA